jgi:hypothetical protein
VFTRRVSLVVGHFGSGKTEIALNGALAAAESGVRVALVDLDFVKPYFRSRAARAVLADAGVELVAPVGEHFYADLPILVPQVRSLLREPDRQIILDVGGDDTGSRVVGSLSDLIWPDEVDCLLVLNFRRPFTPDPEGAVVMAREIEAAARVRLTGLISNTHLLGETTAEVVLEGMAMAEETGRRLGLPVRAVTVDEELIAALAAAELPCPVVALRRIVLPPFDPRLRLRTSGPLFVLS